VRKLRWARGYGEGAPGVVCLPTVSMRRGLLWRGCKFASPLADHPSAQKISAPAGSAEVVRLRRPLLLVGFPKTRRTAQKRAPKPVSPAGERFASASNRGPNVRVESRDRRATDSSGFCRLIETAGLLAAFEVRVSTGLPRQHIWTCRSARVVRVCYAWLMVGSQPSSRKRTSPCPFQTAGTVLSHVIHPRGAIGAFAGETVGAVRVSSGFAD